MSPKIYLYNGSCNRNSTHFSLSRLQIYLKYWFGCNENELTQISQSLDNSMNITGSQTRTTCQKRSRTGSSSGRGSWSGHDDNQWCIPSGKRSATYLNIWENHFLKYQFFMTLYFCLATFFLIPFSFQCSIETGWTTKTISTSWRVGRNYHKVILNCSSVDSFKQWSVYFNYNSAIKSFCLWTIIWSRYVSREFTFIFIASV